MHFKSFPDGPSQDKCDHPTELTDSNTSPYSENKYQKFHLINGITYYTYIGIVFYNTTMYICPFQWKYNLFSGHSEVYGWKLCISAWQGIDETSHLI